MVFKRQCERDRERNLSLVWHAAALNAQASIGKLPELAKLLKKAKGVEKQTRSEQAAVIAQMAAQLGTSLKRTRLIRKES